MKTALPLDKHFERCHILLLLPPPPPPLRQLSSLLMILILIKMMITTWKYRQWYKNNSNGGGSGGGVEASVRYCQKHSINIMKIFSTFDISQNDRKYFISPIPGDIIRTKPMLSCYIQSTIAFIPIS